MKILTALTVAGSLALFTFGASADEAKEAGDKPCPIGKKCASGDIAKSLGIDMDANGDGTISAEEREAARDVRADAEALHRLLPRRPQAGELRARLPPPLAS